MYEMFPDLWPNKNVGIAKAIMAIPDLDSKSGITRSEHHISSEQNNYQH